MTSLDNIHRSGGWEREQHLGEQQAGRAPPHQERGEKLFSRTAYPGGGGVYISGRLAPGGACGIKGVSGDHCRHQRGDNSLKYLWIH